MVEITTSPCVSFMFRINSALHKKTCVHVLREIVPVLNPLTPWSDQCLSSSSKFNTLYADKQTGDESKTNYPLEGMLLTEHQILRLTYKKMYGGKYGELMFRYWE